MITFREGPARGKTLTLQRAPIYLRVAHGPDGALDMPEDQPADNEVVHVYRRLGPARVMFMCGRGRGQRSGGRAPGSICSMPSSEHRSAIGGAKPQLLSRSQHDAPPACRECPSCGDQGARVVAAAVGQHVSHEWTV